MRILMLLAAGVGLLTLAACDQKHGEREHHGRAVRREALRVIDRLDCPEKQGELRRVSVAADGRSCAYASKETEVVLRLIALDGGDAETVLAPIETDLKTLIPAPKAAPLPAKPGGKSNNASIRLPGVRIDAGDHGADIKIGGLSINSRDDNAQVRIDHNVTVRGDKTVDIQAEDSENGDGDVAIHADENGAEIRKRRLGPQSIRATLILASDKAASGYHVVGYEARGPKGGPIAVAVVKAKDRNSDEHDVFKDMKGLIRRNVGG